MRTIWRACSASVFAVVLPLAACQRAVEPVRAPAGSPPMLWALVLEVRDTSVHLHSVTPTRGTVVASSIDDRSELLRSGGAAWIEYELHGPANAVLGRGAFVVSHEGISEPATPRTEPLIVRTAAPVVIVGVPYSADLSTISFARAEPSPGDPAEWRRVPLGSVSISRVAR